MKRSLKTTLYTLSLVGLGTIATLSLNVNAASANSELGMHKGYAGAGVSGSVTNGGTGNDGLNFGGNVQGRVKLQGVPASIRGTLYFNGNNTAVVPTVTYDIPVAKGTNVYAGVGGAFVQNQGVNSPIGTRDSVVLNAGVEKEVAKGVVVYTDAKLGINAYQGSPASAVGLSGGVGFQF